MVFLNDFFDERQDETASVFAMEGLKPKSGQRLIGGLIACTPSEGDEYLEISLIPVEGRLDAVPDLVRIERARQEPDGSA